MFIARQPIFNRDLNVYGYELLFRLTSDSKVFGDIDSKKATAAVIQGLFESGIEKIVEDKKAFINFDENLIYSDVMNLISNKKLVIELLENIELKDKLNKRVIQLRKKGYKIALDDFVKDYDEYPLVKTADIIKYDLLETPLDELDDIVKRPLRDNKIILAEKIETKEEFIKAKKMGFHLFQGYFFNKPEIVNQVKKKRNIKTQYISLLNELEKDEPDFQNIAEIIEKDVNLSYKLIKLVSLRISEEKIYSIKSALTYLGINELKYWIELLMIQDTGKDLPKEILRLTLIRSKFTELIAKNSILSDKRLEASLMGLLSNINVLLGTDFEKAIADISVTPSIKQVLLYNKGELKNLYQLMLAYENSNWEKVIDLSEKLNINKMELYELYTDAVIWSKKIMDKI